MSFESKKTRIVEAGDPTRLGRDLRRPRHEFRAVFRLRGARRALPVRFQGPRDRARHPARIHRRDLARLTAGDWARANSTATACTAPTIRRPAIASIRNKLLIDPYAKLISGEIKWGQPTYGYKFEDEAADLSFDETDSAAVDAEMRRRRARRRTRRRRARPHPLGPRRSSTKRTCAASPSCTRSAQKLRGHLRGHGEHKDVIAYIKSLGVTSVELMPIHWFVDDDHLLQKGLRNYWGYNSLGFFAPMTRYLGPKGLGGVPRHGARLSRRRPRGDPRRGLQPHRRRQREGADALVQGHRQLLLLSHDAERGALLHQRHRHRKHGQHLASARAADGAGFAALLGDRDGSRRLPLRSRHHSRAASPTASISAAASSTPSARTRCFRG